MACLRPLLYAACSVALTPASAILLTRRCLQMNFTQRRTNTRPSWLTWTRHSQKSWAPSPSGPCINMMCVVICMKITIKAPSEKVLSNSRRRPSDENLPFWFLNFVDSYQDSMGNIGLKDFLPKGSFGQARCFLVLSVFVECHYPNVHCTVVPTVCMYPFHVHLRACLSTLSSILKHEILKYSPEGMSSRLILHLKLNQSVKKLVLYYPKKYQKYSFLQHFKRITFEPRTLSKTIFPHCKKRSTYFYFDRIIPEIQKISLLRETSKYCSYSS